MKIIRTNIPEVIIIEPTVYEDARGWFIESFNTSQFYKLLAEAGLPTPATFVQDNLSCSKYRVLRGLHYQLPPFEQGKLVRVISGAAFDVAIDIREGSPSYGKSVSAELNESNKRMMWIPEGFAHGFQALVDNTIFAYKTTNYYSVNHERSIRFDDPLLDIAWPLESPIVNEKDRSAPLFSKISQNLG